MPVTEHAAHGRFTVLLSGPAVQQAKAAGIDLPSLVSRALDRINTLLPGPKTTITVNYDRPADLIPQTGTAGVTLPHTGHISTGAERTGPGTRYGSLAKLEKLGGSERPYATQAPHRQPVSSSARISSALTFVTTSSTEPVAPSITHQGMARFSQSPWTDLARP